MPIHEIRESIELGQGVFTEKSEFGFKYIFQKRINLQAGKVHRMLQTDFFLDNPYLDTNTESLFMQFYVTPLPVIYTNMRYGPYLNVGPAAANNYVLYKANLDLVRPTAPEFESLRILSEFPNDSLGTFPTFDWYSPNLYLTLIVNSQEPLTVLGPVAMTFYAAVESKNVSYVKSMCGRLKERQEAHIATIMNNGHMINAARNSGQIFPMWRHGGVRSSGMLAADQFGQFALPGDGMDGEQMWDNNDLLAAASAGRTMVSTPEPFGQDTAAYGFIPDWLVMDLPMGIQFGPIRDQFPQTLYNDAGVTRMV